MSQRRSIIKPGWKKLQKEIKEIGKADVWIARLFGIKWMKFGILVEFGLQLKEKNRKRETFPFADLKWRGEIYYRLNYHIVKIQSS